MNKIIITGGSGLVGSRIVDLLSSEYEFEKVSRQTGVNITKSEEVLNFFKKNDAQVVIHLAAKADADRCELDKEKDEKVLNSSSSWEGSETAYGVNVFGTKNVADAAEETGKKLIYISTDFVFDGEKEDPYDEDDVPSPINWYARTKYLGEEQVKKVSRDFTIVRVSYPYRAEFPKKDFVRAMIDRFERSETVSAVIDHTMTPTFIDDIALALKVIIQNNEKGIFHVVGSSFISPVDAAKKIAEIFRFENANIAETTRQEFFKGRAPRPFHLDLKNDKIARLGVQMRTFEEGLLELKRQI